MPGANTGADTETVIRSVEVTDDEIVARLSDGRTIAVPLAWSWRLAALRSRRGASNKLLSLVGTGLLTSVVSVPLIFEYEDVALRHLEHISYSADEVREIINFVCSMSDAYPIYYLWRPFLPDPGDDHVLELAVAARCDSIITFNLRDFRGAERFGLQAQTPGMFLKEIHT